MGVSECERSALVSEVLDSLGSESVPESKGGRTSLSEMMSAHLWFVHNLKVILRVGERTFSCDCSEEFGLEFDESCTTKWTYFCNPNFIAHYGYKVTLNSNWVQSFNKSIATDIYGHSVAEYPELPLGKANILITLIFFYIF